VHKFFRVALIAVALLSAWGAYYVHRRGLTKSWRELVMRELRVRGVEATLEKLTVTPFRGVVAKKVRVYESKDRKRVVAVVDELFIEPNYAQALQKKMFVESLSLRDATIQLPVQSTGEGSGPVQVTGIRARLLLPPNQVVVSEFEANINGVKIKGAGRLANTNLWKPNTEGLRTVMEVAGKAAMEIAKVKFTGEAPEVSARFSHDFAKPTEFSLSVGFTGDGMLRESYRLNHARLLGEWKNGRLTIPLLELDDAGGKLEATVTYDAASGALTARGRSTLNGAGLMQAWEIPFPMEGVEVNGRLDVEARLEATLNGVSNALITGSVRAGDVMVDGVHFSSASADVAWEGEWARPGSSEVVTRRWIMREARFEEGGDVVQSGVIAEGGKVRIQFQGVPPVAAQERFLPGGVRRFTGKVPGWTNVRWSGRLEREIEEGKAGEWVGDVTLTGEAGSLDLAVPGGGQTLTAKARLKHGVLAALAGAPEWLREPGWLACAHPIRLRWSTALEGPDEGTAHGEFELAEAKVGGAPVETIWGTFAMGDGVVRVKEFTARRSDGELTGEFSVDTRTKVLTVPGITSRIEARALAAMFLPEFVPALEGVTWRGEQQPVVRVSGTMDGSGLSPRGMLRVEFEAPGEVVFGPGLRPIRLQGVRGQSRWRDGRWELQEFNGRFAGGTVSGRGQVARGLGMTLVRGRVAWEDVALSEVTAKVFGRSFAEGTVGGEFDFTLPGGALRDLAGSGTFKIAAGPRLMGPLSSVLPGPLAAVRFGGAKGGMRVSSGIVYLSDLELEGGTVRVVANGSVEIENQRCDLTVRMGGAARETGGEPVLLYRIHGNLNAPEVTLVTPQSSIVPN
jgi:hypothetical protein